MSKINIVYSLSGGKGVSYIASFLACYTNSIAVDMNYIYPSLKRYKNVKSLNVEDLIFLEEEKYLEYSKDMLMVLFNKIKQNKESSYVIDIGNLLLSEFVSIFKSNRTLNYIKKLGIEISFHCVISGDDKPFNHRAIMSFNEGIKYLEFSSLTIWENRYLENSSNSEELKKWASAAFGKKCFYKIVEKESEILNNELNLKMKFVVPLSPKEIKEGRDVFSYIRLKNYYRKWEKLTEREKPLF